MSPSSSYKLSDAVDAANTANTANTTLASDLYVVGVSHRTVPIQTREKLAITQEDIPRVLRAFQEKSGFHEGLLISTCNRVELYTTTSHPPQTRRAVAQFFAERAGSALPARAIYDHRSTEAIQHAFRVAASLDSLVVGEPQILGQLKKAFEQANDAGTVGTLLGRCFSRAFAVAKRVRTETGIAQGTVSVSSVACELAQKIFGSLAGRHVLLVGAGDMGEAAARALQQTGASLFVINRHIERAAKLAEACGGTPCAFDTLPEQLAQADVVIASTASDRFVLTLDLMQNAVRARKRKPLFMIDIAVPRDIDPQAGDLENVFLYDLDDLEKVAKESMHARKKEAQHAEKLILAEVEEFEAWRRALTLTPTIVALRQRFLDTIQDEINQTSARLPSLSPKEKQMLERMGHTLANKLLHAPITQLKRTSEEAVRMQRIEAAHALFELTPAPKPTTEQNTTQNIKQASTLTLASATTGPGHGSNNS